MQSKKVLATTTFAAILGIILLAKVSLCDTKDTQYPAQNPQPLMDSQRPHENRGAWFEVILNDQHVDIMGQLDEVEKSTLQTLEAIQRGDPQEAALAEILQSLHAIQRKILLEGIANKSEEITRGINNKQEKCIAIARWVASNIRNASAHPEIHAFSGDADANLERFASRIGPCGARSRMFVLLADFAGIHAELFSLYNFGGPGGAHTCVQANYNSGWHYFDVTYGGYFLDDQGQVLSFEQIRDDPGAAIERMQVIHETKDYYGDKNDPSTWYPVIPSEQLASVYNLGRLKTVRSFGFPDSSSPITIHASIDAQSLVDGPLVIGEINNSSSDMQSAGIAAGVSEQLRNLGTFAAYMYHEFVFTNAQQGSVYEIVITPTKTFGLKDSKFHLETANATLIAGDNYDGSGHWVIQMKAHATEFALRVDHAFKERRQGILVDSMTFKIVE